MRGKVRVRSTDGRIYIDFHPDIKGKGRMLWSDRGRGFRDEDHAKWVGEEIHRLEASGTPLVDAVGAFRSQRSRPNLVSTKLEAYRLHLVEDGEIKPYTLDGYLSILRCHCDFWDGKIMLDVGYGNLEVWRNELLAKNLKGKTIKSIFAFFRGFLRDHRRREPSFVIPEFPRIKVEQPEKPRMPLNDLVRVLAKIPAADRGIFLCMAYTTIRPGEARAICVEHYNWKTGVLEIREALKTQSGANPDVGETKTGSRGKYPVPNELRRWLAENTPTAKRFEARAPLFPNPRTGNMYKRAVLTDIWRTTCEKIGVDYVPVYAATKRSGLTALSEAGYSIEDIQAMGRHKNSSMTREYIVEDDQKRARAASGLQQLIEEEREK